MYRHARNTMLTLSVDYTMTKDDIKAWQHLWTQSMRESQKLTRFETAAKIKQRF